MQLIEKLFKIFIKVFFTIIFFVPGCLIVGYIIYSSVDFQIETSGYTRASISYLETNEADTTGKTVNYNLIDQDGKEVMITDKAPRLRDEDGEIIYIFGDRVRFDPTNPTQLYYESSWFGKGGVIVFGSIFLLIGFAGITGTNVFEKPRRIVVPFIALCILAIGLGLLVDYMVALNKDSEERFNYGYIAAFLVLIGGFLLINWLRIQKIWKELDTIGTTLAIKDFSVTLKNKVMADPGSLYEKIDTNNEVELLDKSSGLLIKVQVHRDKNEGFLATNPYIITLKYVDRNNKVQAFATDYIWFNPTPFIKGEIKVKVHPRYSNYHKIDTSFLPDTEIADLIGRISYTL